MKGRIIVENNTKIEHDALYIASEAVKVLLEKKGRDVTMYYVGETSSVTDYYVNVSGGSNTQVAALADEVVYKLGLQGINALRVEGRRANEWLLVDFGDVIINVFDRKSREFYDLDRHFSIENRVDISHLVAEVDKKYDINN